MTAARYAVDAFRVHVEGSSPHTHLVAVGTSTCQEGEPVTGAITPLNVPGEGAICTFHDVMLVVRPYTCSVCGESVLAITPAYLEESLPEGEVGVNFPPDDPPPPC